MQRLRPIKGHVRGLIQMIEADHCCLDELQQANAITSTLCKVALPILTSHLDAGLDFVVRSGETEAAVNEVSTVLRAALRL